MRRFVCLLLLLGAWPVAAALDGKQQELSELRFKIEALQEELEQASEDRTETADSLKTSERRISQVNRALRQLRQKRGNLLSELKSLNGETKELQAQLRQHERQLGDLLKQRYTRQAEDGAKLLLNGQNPTDISRQLEYYTYIGQARAKLIESHRATLDRLNSLRKATELKSHDLDQISRDREAQRQTLEKEKLARREILDKLSDRIQQQRKEIGSLKRDEQRLGRLIEKLRNLALSRKSKTAKPKAKAGEKVTQVADSSLAGISFTKLKGKLALPVAGEIAARYGESRPGGGPAWKGLFIRARSGEEVHAVASGEVVFSDWLRGFGNLLIVDHDGGYLSLYSNNESLYKQPGEPVRAGDVVASIGNTGGQDAPGLYFELRHQGKPFDPLNWVSRK